MTLCNLRNEWPARSATSVPIESLESTIAARAVVSDIEIHAVCITIDGARWWDVRPMLDEREHSAEVVDMAQQAIEYALARDIITRHTSADLQHLVRINRPSWI